MSDNNTPAASPRVPPAQEANTPRYTSLESSIYDEGEEGASRPQQRRGEYGTMSSRPQLEPARRPSGTGSPTGRRDESGMVPISPQNTARQTRPSTIRRISIKKPMPHRGDYFSVDDDPSEVEEDRAPTPRTESFAPMARQMSSVRRRTYAGVSQLPRVDSHDEDDVETRPKTPAVVPEEPEEEELEEGEETADVEEDEEDTLSDVESFTLKDRQLAINETHPFGIRIWKPALYRKVRSVEKNAEDDIHSSPSQIVSTWLWGFNVLWTILFGWWLSLFAAIAAVVCYIFAFAPSAVAYGRVFLGLADYLFWPFGKFVKLEQDESYLEEDEGEGRSISEYERWQAGDLEYGRLMFGPTLTHTGSIVGRRRDSIDEASEHDSLLDRSGRGERNETGLGAKAKRRLFGRGEWTLGRVIFFIFFYFNVAPLLLLVSGICWFLIFWIPMGRVTSILVYHLRKRPLALTFHRDATYARNSTKPSSILICTYRAVGTKYWKYTIDGTNIFLINFLAVVVFVILDYFILKKALGLHIALTSPALLFTMSLISIIPLAYFIGQAVASISAQSTMGVGAAVNAFFSTIVEVYLYCIALNEGKSKLVEGSVIGSVFAGILLLPGLSMCFGAIKRKTQRFNAKSASASSTLLLFATIALFGPTLFYKIYGSHELICKTCNPLDLDEPRDCRQCYFRQALAVNDDFFLEAVRPYCWIAAVLLCASYFIGLLFTLRTHAAIIWSTDLDEKKPPPNIATGAVTTEISPMDTRANPMERRASVVPRSASYVPKANIRDSQLYKKILGQSLQQAGIPADGDEHQANSHGIDHANKSDGPHIVPPKKGSQLTSPVMRPIVPGLSEEDNNNLARHFAEMAATAAAVAARDAAQNPRVASYQATHSGPTPKKDRPNQLQRVDTLEPQSATLPPEGESGGHDAPNWSRTKSTTILLTATVAYAIVAEVLVNTVDVVLENSNIDEKFLGITLFALVPNTTEFLNAISFAMNGNIALSMEIGSAYALQVCLLQVPALVAYSGIWQRWLDTKDLIDHTFNLIFPQWDMVTVILCVFLYSYMCGEGKSNYFKGSVLVLTYLVVVMGFYYSGYTGLEAGDGELYDTLALGGNMVFQGMGGRTAAGSGVRKTEL